MFEEDKDKIISALNEKLPNLKCPMCGGDQFLLADGYITDGLQNDLHNIQIGGKSLPSIAIVCKHCGFISFHSVGVLGLLDSNNQSLSKGETPSANK